MKNYNNHWLAGLAALLLLACSFSAFATAPRVTAQMFGEERKADIVAYQSVETQPDGALVVEIVTAAFRAAGKSPVLDVLPSRQLAVYELFSSDALALIGSPQDLATKDRKQYSVVTFYLSTQGDKPAALIFSNARGGALKKVFIDGMQKLFKSGKYLAMIEKSRGKLPADYISRVKRQNPGWK